MIDTRWDKAISNISDYLVEKENDDDDEARVLHLLYETREMLKKEKRQVVRDVREEENLFRTNTYRKARSPNGLYAAAAKRNTIDDEIHGSLRPTVTYHLIQTDNALRKEEKEITIRISDETERRKVCKRKVKRLMKRIKKVVSKLIKMNRIKSKDIKITVSIKKVKAVLLKDIE